MKTKIIEVGQSIHGPNWGKILLGRMDSEWKARSGLYEAARQATDDVMGEDAYDRLHGPSYSRPGTAPLLHQLGWGPEHLWVLDLQTGEGVLIRPGGSASADLDKHKVWVCPMFEPFLAWLYQQNLGDLDALPSFVALPDARFDYAGYRRQGGE